MTSPLFTPFQLKGLTLPNRFVMPAMQRGMCEDGKPTAALAAYYRRRAEGGVPLIIGESAAVDHPTATRQPSRLGALRRTSEPSRRADADPVVARRGGAQGRRAVDQSLGPGPAGPCERARSDAG